MDRVPGLGAQRVHDPDQRDEDQVRDRGHRVGQRGRHRRVVHVLGGERQHPQPALGQLAVGGQEVVPDGADRHLLAMPQGPVAAVQDHVRRALDGDQMRLPDDRAGQPVRAVVEGGHELVLGIERHLGPAGQGFAGLLGVHAHLRGQHHERRLGRVADDRPVVADGGVGAQHQAQGQVAEVRRLRPGHAQDRAGLDVAGAFDLEPVAAAQHGGRGHRVHRQRAGLVAVDDGRPAQGLHVAQRLDHRLGLGQPPRPGGQHGLHERGQPGRDRRDRGRDAQQHQGGGVLAPHEAEDGDDRHGQEGDQAEHLGHAVQFALQRGPGALGGGDHPGDLAHLGGAAGGGHHDRRGAPGDLGVLEHQVGPVAECHLTAGQRARVLGDRRALPGERGLLHLQRGRGHDPPVRRDHVPGLQQHDVTRHQFGRFELGDLPGAPHPGMRHLQLGQRLHAGPGLQLLGRAHHHVERHQPQHHHAPWRSGRWRSWPRPRSAA